MELIGDVTKNFSILCNISPQYSNQTIGWIRSINKSSSFLIQNDSRISFSKNENEYQLNFLNLYLNDQQYYACGLIGDKFIPVLEYFLFVRGELLQMVLILMGFVSS